MSWQTQCKSSHLSFFFFLPKLFSSTWTLSQNVDINQSLDASSSMSIVTDRDVQSVILCSSSLRGFHVVGCFFIRGPAAPSCGNSAEWSFCSLKKVITGAGQFPESSWGLYLTVTPRKTNNEKCQLTWVELPALSLNKLWQGKTFAQIMTFLCLEVQPASYHA